MFQMLLGDRYGDTSLHDTIPACDFQVLMAEATKTVVKHLHLLDEMYEFDENAVPPAYVLKVCCMSTYVTCNIISWPATMWGPAIVGPRCPSVCHMRISPKLSEINIWLLET